MLDNNVLVILDISKITLLDAQKICRVGESDLIRLSFSAVGTGMANLRYSGCFCLDCLV